MKLKYIEEFINNLFDTKNNEIFAKESGFTIRGNNEIQRIGFCTNLTLATIEEAIKNNVDLMITHHDAWDFIFGLKDECYKKLSDNNISHYYNHIPLDDCNFGTNNSLIDKLGLQIIEKTHEIDGFYCGRIAEFKEEVSLNELVNKLEALLEEPVKSWQFNNRNIKRVGLACGGASLTTHVKTAVDKKCDVYITGEKTLYTIEYAGYAKINLIIGSHTFTEIFGVESLARKVKEKYDGIDIVKLHEEHLEV